MPHKKQALIAEEDHDLAAELCSLLDSIGFSVTAIDDPEKIAETLGNHIFEVALINVRLPGLSWRSTLRTIKNASRTTTVIMMTKAFLDDVRLALNSGSYVVLDRPLTHDQLAKLLSPQYDGLFVALR